MKKKNIDMHAIKIARKRFDRELNLKRIYAPELYLAGYDEAINDFLWDYAGLTSHSLEGIKEKQEH